ncbi:Uncharacterised protein [Acetobacterium wieringae]|uniref:minor capsid protein n=1 Tax=Acetobacterium wieringae TaxID=52694 RepID=UPI001D3F70F0|nr:minor capsid protein [Acetobacterium wieringae]VUZ28520.1 Uncharacterised protein [Acetobacterium wieringae]
MKQADYWKNRFTQLEEAQNQKALDYYSTLEDEFSRAARNVDKELAAWYTRFAKNENISYEEAKQVLTKGELSAFKMSVEDYIKKGKTLPYSDQWAKELERASAKFHVTRLEAMQLQMQQQIELMYGYELDTFDRFISNQYKAGYYKTMFEFQKGFGVGFDVMKLDDNKIAKLIAKPWAPDGQNFSSRIWRDKNKLMTEMPSILTQATIRGDGYAKTTKLLADRFNVSKSQAKNLVITESAFFSSASQTDCFNDLGVKQYEIIATLDGLTSPICRSMDGKVFDMKDRRPGITCPPFHNRCRSTSCPAFNDEFELNTKRAARDPDSGKTYQVPANMKYPDWEKSFVNGGSKDGLEVLKGGIINVSNPFQPATSTKEAEEYADLIGIKANYEGFNLDVANMVNKELTSVKDLFPDINQTLTSVSKYPKRAPFVAAYDGSRKEIRLTKVKTKDALSEMKKAAERNLSAGFWSTDEMEHAIRHEIGHAIQHLTVDNDPQKLAKITAVIHDVRKQLNHRWWSMKDTAENMKAAGDTISYYALKSEGEFIAESVAEYLAGNPRDTAAKVMKILLEGR